MKNIVVFAFLAMMSSNFIAQVTTSKKEVFFVNVLINENKEIWLDSGVVEFDNLSESVYKIIDNQSSKIDAVVVYRIYANETVPVSYINDVEQKLFDGHAKNARSMQFQIEETQVNLYTSNWFQKLEAVKFKKIKG